MLLSFTLKLFYVILFYKMKEGACKKGRVDSESGVCVGELSVGGNNALLRSEILSKNWCCEVFDILLILIKFG